MALQNHGVYIVFYIWYGLVESLKEFAYACVLRYSCWTIAGEAYNSQHICLSLSALIHSTCLNCLQDTSTSEYFEGTGWTHLPASINVWPLPQKISLSDSNFTISLYSQFIIHTTSESPILDEGIERYHSILQTISKKHAETGCGNGTIRRIEIVIDEDDETLSLNTSYKYTVTVDINKGIIINAETSFGAL